MKVVTIGDLHGRTCWKSVEPEKYDRIIFIGDYVDSFTHSDKEILDNLNEVIRFKKAYPGKVVLLWGNHDVQYYLDYDSYGCSGFRPRMYSALHHLFNLERHLFTPVFVIRTLEQEYVWTHAGISKSWYYDYFYPEILGQHDKKIEKQITWAFDRRIPAIFQVGRVRGGYLRVGGIVWADMSEVRPDPCIAVHQIAGHSPVPDIQKFEIDYFTSVTFVDCLDKREKFYELKIT